MSALKWLLAIGIVSGAFGVVMACGSNKTTACTPNEVVQCTTGTGCPGTAMCLPNGSAFSACACGADGGADGSVGEAGVFSPASFGSELAFWIADDSIVLGTDQVHVNAWTDKTIFKNDVLAELDAGGSVGVPTIDTEAGAHQVVMMRDTVGSLPTPMITAGNGSGMDFGTGDFAIESVVNLSAGVPNDTTPLVIVAKDQLGTYPNFTGWNLALSTVGAIFHYESAGNAQATIDLKTQAGANIDFELHIVDARRVGTKLTVRIDGTVQTASFGADLTNTAPLTVAAGFSSGIFYGSAFPGNVAEIFVVRGTVEDGKQLEIDSYFKTKFGL